jgi:hypothetical protein
MLLLPSREIADGLLFYMGVGATRLSFFLLLSAVAPCRFERLKETAFEYAFLLKTAGMLDVKPKPGSSSTAAAPAAAAS